MGEIGAFLAAAGVRERALVVLVLTIAGLIVMALVFASYTILLRARNELSARRWKRLGALWEEPVLNAVLDPDTAPRVHEVVEPRYRLHFVRFVLEYSRRVKGEERAALRALALPYLGPLAARTRSARVEVRTRAVQTLGTLGLPAYAAEVVAALDDRSPLVAMVAARALCREEHPEYLRDVLPRLARFEGWSRGFLASMLAAVGPAAAPALRETLGDETRAPAARAVAADALRLLSDLQSADTAAHVAAQEHEPELVAAALRLLTLVGRPEHIAVIRDRCTSRDSSVRASAVAALGTLALEEDRLRLLGAMSDESPWVAIAGARALIAAGGRAALRELSDSDHPRALLAQQVLLEEGGEG